MLAIKRCQYRPGNVVVVVADVVVVCAGVVVVVVGTLINQQTM